MRHLSLVATQRVPERRGFKDPVIGEKHYSIGPGTANVSYLTIKLLGIL